MLSVPLPASGPDLRGRLAEISSAQWMSSEDPVETVRVVLAGLELTITARRVQGAGSGSASSASFEIVASGAVQEESSAIFARLLPFLDPLVAKLSASKW